MMKLKLFVILIAALAFLMVAACNSAPPTASLVNNPAPASAPPDGVDPPHAVDTSGKASPNEGTTQPDKPIILAKDSEKAKENSGELKPEAAFDHVKHSTLANYGLDGKAVASCVDCHHTDQPSAPATTAFLKKFERKEVLTAKQLEASKQPVKSCRACHFQASAEETDEYPPASVTYPKEMNRPPSGKLTNEIAYHNNCIVCHEAAKKRDAKIKAPVTCADCHTK